MKSPPRPDPRSAAALEASLAKLGKSAALARRIGAVRDAKLTSTKAQLLSLLKRSRYVPHPSLIRFELDFGGLLLPTTHDDEWRDEAKYVLVGCSACLRSGGHGRPRGGPTQKHLELVPIAYDPEDRIVFLDRAGRAYFQDTIGDVDAVPFADNGQRALIKMMSTGRRADDRR